VRKLFVPFLVLTVMFTLLGNAVMAQEGEEIPLATVVNDEGGPVMIKGEYAYSDPDLPDYGSQPVIFLGDVSNLFVEGGFDFSTEYLNLNSPQILGVNTSDIHDGPLTYEIRLPIDPGGVLDDVDNDAEKDSGVMIYTVNFTFNGIDDPYIDSREFIYYSSVTQSQDFETQYQINGGTFVVYAPEEGQGFPSGFGADGKLFTEDDPIVIIPQGWTVVSTDADPFTFDRSREGVVNVVESAGTEYADFSALSYTEAFDQMIDMMRKKYAFTELKGIDWDALIAEFRPRFEEAENNQDANAYYLAFRDFEWSIPDGHVGSNTINYLVDQFYAETDGGLGMAIRDLDDGKVITNFILPGGPADTAGIQLRAEILEINGKPVDDVVSASVPWAGPFSAEHVKRLQQLRYAIRFPVGTEVEITYQNPGDAEPTTVPLTAVPERDSFSFSSLYRGLTGFELPLEFELLDNGYGYIKIYSFSDDNLLTLMLWQRAMWTFNEAGVPGIILDMRQNGGGSPDIGNVMLGYFFDEETYTGTSAFYYEDLGRFELDPLYAQVIFPADEDDRYHGDIAVLISPNCASMCEFFTYTLTLLDDVKIVGQYPTAGLGGGIKPYAMPGGVYAQFPEARSVGADNEIHIEGMGVAPDVRVPVNEETLFAENDVILDQAVVALEEAQAVTVIDSGAIVIGDEVSGELNEGEAARYSLALTPADTFSIYVEAEAGFVLRLYAEDGETLYIETGEPALEGLATDVEETILVEVEAVGAYTLKVPAVEGK
jgi:C-terminal processing protease CtpA/Prc